MASQLKNRMFDGSPYVHFGDATHWMRPSWLLREEGRRHGFEFVTEDLIGLDETCVFLMMEMPQSPGVVLSLRKQHPHLKIVLQISESPLGRQWTFDPLNHRMFDAVLTYNHTLSGGEKYFTYKLPAGGLDEWDGLANETPWHERKTACMVANVPNVRPWLPRRSGLGMMRAGWRFGPSTWWNYIAEQGSLYGKRLAVAQALSGLYGDDFDIYGPGWTDVASITVRNAARGIWPGSKLVLLGSYKFNIAFENCLNDCGYISEKMFDALLAGTVPVYLGNLRIEEFVPHKSFVDARRFSSPEALGRYLRQMPWDQWQEMHDAGAEFLRNQAPVLFGSRQYVDAVLGAVRYVLAHEE